MSNMSLIHHPVYLPFEENIVCSECLLYYKCENCIRICNRQIKNTDNFKYFNYYCDDCNKMIKILLCSICNKMSCKGGKSCKRN